jgi:hypothetical protein
MAAGATYTPIATYTLPSAQASYTFTSISGAYTDLVLVVEGISSSAVNGICMQFNGDTSSGLYSNTVLSSNGSVASANRRANGNFINIAFESYWVSSSRSSIIVNIQNYANTNVYKSCLSRPSTAATGVDAIAGLWRNGAAITSLTVTNDGSGNIGATTSFTLYGILAA